MARRPVVFSSTDLIAEMVGFANLEDADRVIADGLQRQCERGNILSLDGTNDSFQPRHLYLGTRLVTEWWANRTMRWANAKLSHLGEADLAREMALAFDQYNLATIPVSVLDIGRQRGMVADGNAPGVFVLPWAVVLQAHPQWVPWFVQWVKQPHQVVFPGSLSFDTENEDLQDACDLVLSTLTDREASIIRGRLGFETGKTLTLEQLGKNYGVTRERIRQLEKKAWRKILHPRRRRPLWNAFGNSFLRFGGSLLILNSIMTPQREFLHRGIGLNATHIPRLGLRIIAPEKEAKVFSQLLSQLDEGQSSAEAFSAICFLSQSDVEHIRSVWQARHVWDRSSWTRSRMLLEAMRFLGRAAHFEEIAEECNRLFPNRSIPTRNWHSALSLAASPENEQFGIVWIGRKGMYGLKEHGYSRPDTDIFEGVARIVETVYGKTQRPVSEQTVFRELGKERRELSLTSVAMALSFNDRVEPVGRGNYIPKATQSAATLGLDRTTFDLDAAFDAFVLADCKHD